MINQARWWTYEIFLLFLQADMAKAMSASYLERIAFNAIVLTQKTGTFQTDKGNKH